MDEQTYGNGTLRFMNQRASRSNLNHSITLNIIKIWEIFFYLLISTSLAFLLIRKGWEPINKQHIQIKGTLSIPKEFIIQAMEIQFPIGILEINPKQLESNLKKKLSLQSVAINRRIAPLGLEVKILERVPIAVGFRLGSNGEEKGLIDKKGYWIPINQPLKFNDHSPSLVIEGWSEPNQKLIALILQKQKGFEYRLKRIIFNPNGDISLQTKEFALIHLGKRADLLKKQLEAISHLSKSLQNELINDYKTILDLKNPLKPKLLLGDKKNSSKTIEL